MQVQQWRIGLSKVLRIEEILSINLALVAHLRSMIASFTIVVMPMSALEALLIITAILILEVNNH